MPNHGVRKKRLKKDYLTYGAHKNGPLKITHPDGTITIEKRKTGKELHPIILKGKTRRTIQNAVKKARQRLKTLQH